MIIPDINLLIYAINRESLHHIPAKNWLEKIISGRETVGFAWIVLLGFIRITTNPKIMTKPLVIETAVEIVNEWLEFPHVQLLLPTIHHWKYLKEILLALGSAGNLTSDSHLAALAMEHKGCLYSTDNDFSRFPNLLWKNPCAKK